MIIGHCPYLMGQLFLIIQKQISDVTFKNTDSDVLAGYDKIYSVNDNEALIGEFEKNRNVDFQRFSITR